MLNHAVKSLFIRSNFLRNKLLALFTIFFISSCALTTDTSHDSSSEIEVLPEYVFAPAANMSENIEQTLATAKAQNKQALLVLGAQWCHDSKGLAQKFSTPEMQKILTENYQTLFIDVGYLEKGFDVVKQFDLPIYYGTPTVMVIDPNSAKLLNRPTMQKWLSANNVELNEYIEYFDSFSTKNHTLKGLNNELQPYLKVINEFENKHAVRLKEAYSVIGPLLKQYMESDNKKATDEFSKKWDEVHALRYRIQDDIQTLIAQAKQNMSNGSTEALTLPEYPSFSWE